MTQPKEGQNHASKEVPHVEVQTWGFLGLLDMQSRVSPVSGALVDDSEIAQVPKTCRVVNKGANERAPLSYEHC